MSSEPLPLEAWADFYVIVGTSGATLTGLMFVVLTLTAERRVPGAKRQVSIFATPTVVHFCVPLLVSGLLTSPWHGGTAPGVILALGGLVGVWYVGVTTWRATRQEHYEPVLEDWVFHSIIPFACYATLVGAGIALRWHPEPALAAIGLVVLALMLVGIHNSWDTLTFFATGEVEKVQEQAAAESGDDEEVDEIEDGKDGKNDKQKGESPADA